MVKGENINKLIKSIAFIFWLKKTIPPSIGFSSLQVMPKKSKGFKVKILPLIPKERVEDVIYFDPGDTQYPMGLNMLEYDTRYPEYKSLIINELMEIFNKLFNI